MQSSLALKNITTNKSKQQKDLNLVLTVLIDRNNEFQYNTKTCRCYPAAVVVFIRKLYCDDEDTCLGAHVAVGTTLWSILSTLR